MEKVMQQEEFEIKEAKRQEIIRPDRFDTSGRLCTLNISGKEYEVINYSSFGIAIFTNQSSFEVVPNCEGTFYVEGNFLAKVMLRWVRQEDLPQGGHKIAFEVTSGPLNLEKINAIFEATQVINDLSQRASEYDSVPDRFKQRVLEVKDLLERFAEDLERIHRARAFESVENIAVFEETVANAVSNFLFKIFEPAYKELAESLKGLDGEAVKKAFSYFREKLGHLLYQSPFAERSFSKPLGYSGDFEMMNQIYRNENQGRTLFAKCLHRYYLEHPETKAVRNRAVFLLSKLVQTLQTGGAGPKKILSVASGPAMEIQMLLQEHRSLLDRPVDIHLLDQDVVSLKHAQSRIRALSLNSDVPVKFKYLNLAIKNIIVRGFEGKEYDLIYSAGLFDYFSDPVATMAAQKIFQSLKPGGKLIIGNFSLTSPNQFLMSIALDWNLIYRSADDIKRLFGSVGGAVSVEFEPEGVNLFCVITK